jgi:hypothetical protein
MKLKELSLAVEDESKKHCEHIIARYKTWSHPTHMTDNGTIP